MERVAGQEEGQRAAGVGAGQEKKAERQDPPHGRLKERKREEYGLLSRYRPHEVRGVELRQTLTEPGDQRKEPPDRAGRGQALHEPRHNDALGLEDPAHPLEDQVEREREEVPTKIVAVRVGSRMIGFRGTCHLFNPIG